MWKCIKSCPLWCFPGTVYHQLIMCRQSITRWAGSGRDWDVSHGRFRNYSSFLVLYIVLHSSTSGCTTPNHARAHSMQSIGALLPGSCAAKLWNARPIELPWGSSEGNHEAISSSSRISQVSECSEVCLVVMSCLVISVWTVPVAHDFSGHQQPRSSFSSFIVRDSAEGFVLFGPLFVPLTLSVMRAAGLQTKISSWAIWKSPKGHSSMSRSLPYIRADSYGIRQRLLRLKGGFHAMARYLR